MRLNLRTASADDADIIYQFIVDLARYEKEPDAVQTNTSVLAEQLALESPPFECLIAEWDRTPCGFALFFHNYSTWRGSAGIYLEDLYVDPAFRGHGVGQALLQRLAQLTLSGGGHRLEWAVLDWNEPAIQFYRQLGASSMSEWTLWRLSGHALNRLAENK